MNLSRSQVKKSFFSDYYKRGQSYAQDGLVLSVRQEGDGTILGEVEGNKLYKQTIRVRGDWIEGACTCPVGRNCKHVAAVMISLMERRERAMQDISVQDISVQDISVQDISVQDISVKLQEPEQNKLAPPNPALTSWIGKMTTLVDPEEAPQVAPKKRKELVFVLNGKRGMNHPLVPVITAQTFEIDKFGDRKNHKEFSFRSVNLDVPQKFLDAEDLDLITSLREHAPSEMTLNSYATLKGDIGAFLLNKLIETGKLRWQNFEGPVVRHGPNRKGVYSWQIDQLGQQNLTLSIAQEVQSPEQPSEQTSELSEQSSLQAPPETPTQAPPKDAPQAPYTILYIGSPRYVDEQSGEIGLVETGMDSKTRTMLEKIPSLGPQEIEAVKEFMMRLGGKLPVPPPIEAVRKVIKDCKPVPVLKLTSIVPHKSYYYGPPAPDKLPSAELFFDYDGVRTPLVRKIDQPITKVKGNEITSILRNSKKEHEAVIQIMAESLVPIAKAAPGFPFQIDKSNIRDHVFVSEEDETLSDSHWLYFILNSVPNLQDMGWVIETTDDFPYKPIKVDDDIDFKIDDPSGIDWFNLGLSTTQEDGRQIDLLPVMINFISKMNDDMFADVMQAPDDKRLCIPHEGQHIVFQSGRIKTILRFLRDLWHMGYLKAGADGKLKMAGHDAALLADIEAASDAARLRWFGGEKLRERIERLRSFKSIAPVPKPAGLNADLRPYQQDGLNWLGFLREYGFGGGILADDMGLGKTLQTLAWILHEKESGRLDCPCLVVAPTSLVHNWQQEAEKFTPDLKILPLQGLSRKEKFAKIADHDVIVTTYPLLPRDRDILLNHKYHAVILDEAQFIKNSKAHMTQIVHQIEARHRLCLTGTPLENHLGELWSLFHFLQPGFLRDLSHFNAAYRRPIEKNGDTDRQLSLQRRIKPFILRRIKEDVVMELPPKTEMIRTAVMDTAQNDLYETVRLSMHKKVRDEIAKKGMAKSHIIVLDALLKLRQVCCDPRLVKADTPKKTKSGSAKLDMLMEMLGPMIEEGRKILLFSQFTEMLKLIEEELDKHKIGYVKLTGQTKDRATPINAFQTGDAQLFLISLKAGGTGLNLTAADTVIHYDPWWNPAVERQATDRAYRIGQDKPVFVYKLLMSGTVEEKILELQRRKQSIADALFSQEQKEASILTEHDISILFEKGE